jgi:crotonobetainyl-CoA:carnitine CoA-transferase CaiB-like acyl-CoA transferase
VSGRQVSAALRALGLEDRKSELVSITDALELNTTLSTIMAPVVRTRSVAHWLAALAAHDVPAAPILDLDEHLADPQVVHNDMYRHVEHPVLGAVRAPRHPAAPDGVIAPSPTLGDGAAPC